MTKDLLKGLCNIYVAPGTGFDESALELFSKLLALCHRHLSLLRLEITFVGDDGRRDPVGTLPEVRWEKTGLKACFLQDD